MYKNLFQNKKLAIFDLDGTTVNTEGLWTKALQNVMEATHSWSVLDERVSGLGLVSKWDFILKENQASQKKSAVEMAQFTEKEFMRLAAELPELPVAPGFWELAVELKEKHNFQLALTTNSTRNILEFVYKKVDFGKTFEFTIAGNEVTLPKPNPEIYNTTLKHFGLSRYEALAFEDSIAGSKASVNAGIDTIILYVHDIHEHKYPKEVKAFVTTFEPFVGRTDYTFMDRFKPFQQEVAKEDQPRV